MKSGIVFLLLTIMSSILTAQNQNVVKLPEPDTQGGLPLMETLSLRQSTKEFDTTTIELKDISNLLWAANGINRPENGKRTAPSAQNAQDIDIFLFNKKGVYMYNAKQHSLTTILKKDERRIFSHHKEDPLPAMICLLVSDISKFKFGEDSLRLEWAAMDAGIVTQNILLFCASNKMACRPKAGMDKESLMSLLKLKDSQHPMLHIPISYK